MYTELPIQYMHILLGCWSSSRLERVGDTSQELGAPYSVSHTVYTLQCVSGSVHLTVYKLYCTPYSIQTTLYTLQCI